MGSIDELSLSVGRIVSTGSERAVAPPRTSMWLHGALANLLEFSDPVVDAILIAVICLAAVALVAGAAIATVDRLHPTTALYLAIGPVVVVPAVLFLGGFDGFGGVVGEIPTDPLPFDLSAATIAAVRTGAVVTAVLVGLVWLIFLLVTLVDLAIGDDRSAVTEGLTYSIVVPLFAAPGLFLLAGVPVALFVRFWVITPVLVSLPVGFVAFAPMFGDTSGEGNPAVLLFLVLLASPLVAVGYGLVAVAELGVRVAVGRLVDVVVLVGSLGVW